ncbi:MAG TPA: HD domain-containing protein [Terriglobales bacterium]|jgi:(p)ppGpp synthase/HD superfamily hydrolase|nr:HD domain-containing protein [Terriglobales bacterium]
MSGHPRAMKLGPRFEEAFRFAAEKHATQTRKKTDVPYISHLMSVAALVLEAGGDEDQTVAALLHDVVEDCGGEPVLEKVRQHFGDRVAKIVAGCSDAYTIPKPAWKQRKLDYLEVLRRADDDVRLVSAADKLHNVRTILSDYRTEGDAVWDRFSGRRDGTLWYYRAVLDVLTGGNPNRLVGELQRVVTELETLARKGIANSASLS